MPSLEILTAREKEILKLVAQGNANKNIASRLKISIRTVETHRSRLIHKLGLKTTAALVQYLSLIHIWKLLGRDGGNGMG